MLLMPLWASPTFSHFPFTVHDAGMVTLIYPVMNRMHSCLVFNVAKVTLINLQIPTRNEAVTLDTECINVL